MQKVGRNLSLSTLSISERLRVSLNYGFCLNKWMEYSLPTSKAWVYHLNNSQTLLVSYHASQKVSLTISTFSKILRLGFKEAAIIIRSCGIIFSLLRWLLIKSSLFRFHLAVLLLMILQMAIVGLISRRFQHFGLGLVKILLFLEQCFCKTLRFTNRNYQLTKVFTNLSKVQQLGMGQTFKLEEIWLLLSTTQLLLTVLRLLISL